MSLTMETAATLLSALLLLLGMREVLLLKRLVQCTTAEGARRWALAALAVGLVAELSRLELFELSLRTRSAVSYFAAVMLLTPLIAILGARRPGFRAWPWFVVLPLVLVLQWPSVSQLMSGRADLSIELPAPTAMGYLLVLIMGAGNYFGTRNTAAALLGSLGTLLLLAIAARWIDYDNVWPRPVASLLFVLTITRFQGRFGDIEVGTKTASIAAANRLWADFRDLFGIVWARRVAERVNQFSDRESWSVLLTLDGFTKRPTTSAVDTGLTEDVPDRAIEILCWVLRRFVDAEFFQRYLPKNQTETLVTQESRVGAED